MMRWLPFQRTSTTFFYSLSQDKIPLEVLQKAYEASICQNLLNVFKDEVENCREAALDLVFDLVVGEYCHRFRCLSHLFRPVT